MNHSVNKLYEYIEPSRGSFVVESMNSGRDLCMKGIFIQAEVRNQNQRVYPLNEITNAVNLMNQKIKGGESILGELDHPPELTINLDRVSHKITEMWMEGNNGCGKLVVIDSVPMGQIAKGLLEAGVKLGVSSRGSGNVNNSGMVSDFEIVTVDIVAQPSAPSAYPKSIYESLFNMRGGAELHRLAQHASYGGDHAAQLAIARNISKFIQELNKK